MSARDRYPFAALLAVEALLVCLFALFCVPDASAQERVWTNADTLRALDGASPLVDCIVRRESGYSPYAVGQAGELGAVQLHPRGLLPDFLYSDWTPLPSEYRSPYNPWQSVAYLEQALDKGMGSHWTTYWGCR